MTEMQKIGFIEYFSFSTTEKHAVFLNLDIYFIYYNIYL